MIMFDIVYLFTSVFFAYILYDVVVGIKNDY
nr:MAG TPA: hypothetical protein [Inoviridae sp.]